MTPSGPVVLIGSRGLLGAAVHRALGRRNEVAICPVVPWDHPAAAASAIVACARASHDASKGDWTLLWCAGAGVVGNSREHFERELATVRAAVDGLDQAPPRQLFVASSAGAVYAGSTAPPFTEHSEVRPVGEYGRAKLRIEAEFSRLAGRSRLLVGRLSNLYGPGQDLTKNQGLITRLCLSSLLREPVGVYVSLDTIRDYLFVDDAAELVLDCVDHLAEVAPAEPIVKILAAQRPVSIAMLLGETTRVLRRRALVRMASSDLATLQARDLRLSSVVWPELDRRPMTPLPVGIDRTFASIRTQLAATGPPH